MSFAVLADDDDDEGDEGDMKTHHQKKMKDALAVLNGKTDKMPSLSVEQKKILKEQKEARTKKKQESEKKKEIESRCFFFDECKNKRQVQWPYCKECYNSRTEVCQSCASTTTTLTSDPGIFHTHCKTCRSTNKTKVASQIK
jgi:hypothetical protein